VGGFLFAAALALPFLAGAGGLAAAAMIILTLHGSFRAERPEGATRAGLRGEIAEGVRWLWRQRLLRTMAIALALLNLTLVAQVAIMVLFARERLGLGPAGYGLLLTAHAAGAVLGSIAARRVVARIGRGRILRFGLFIEAGTPAVIALAGGPLVVGAAFAVFGFHAMVWGAVLTALRQELTPDGLRGRVESVYRLLDSGAAAPGALLGGLLATRFGLTAPFWFGVAVGLLLLPIVWSLFSDAAVASASRDEGNPNADEHG
jgi:MFS family permease